MILKYQELNDKHAECKKIKKHKLWLLSPKEFDAYAKERKNRGLDTKVVRNTSLKKYKPDKNSNEDEYIEIEGEKYRLKPEKKRKAKGYLFTGGNTFVRIEKSYAFLIPILLAIIAGIALWFLLQGKGGKIKPVTPDIDDNDIKDATQIMEEQPMTTFPGYSTVVAKSGASVLQLKNPKENTVYFVYTITETLQEKVVKTYDTSEDAAVYVQDHQKSYENAYDKKTGKYYFITDDNKKTDEMTEYIIQESGSQYVVKERTSSLVFYTGSIRPNKAKDWDIKKSLDIGEHDVLFRIRTYDMDKNASEDSGFMTGNTTKVKVIVQ